MRFKEFKTNLFESKNSDLAASNAIHTVNFLSSVTDKIPEEEGQRLIKFNDTLEKIIDGISKFTDYFKSKTPISDKEVDEPIAPLPAQPAQVSLNQPPEKQTSLNQPPAGELDSNNQAKPVSEGIKYNRRREYHFPDQLQAAKENLETIKEQIKFLESVNTKTDREESLRTQGLDFARKQLESATATFKGFKAAVAERDLFKKQKEEADKFLTDIAKFLTVLGDRVQGYSEGLESIDMTKLKSAERKKIVNAQQFTSTLRQALFGLIIEIANKRETSVTPEQIKGFLQACVDGKVIDMNTVVSKDFGNIREALNEEWRDVFNLFVEKNIFEYSPGTTSGAVGPGEMALSMMANPTEKAPVGDLKVNEVMYEVKAGKKNGGRLNSKGIGKATTGWKVWAELIEKIVHDRAPATARFTNTDNQGKEIQVKPKQFSANKVNPNLNKNTGKYTYKVASKYNWNRSNFDALNNEILIYSTRTEVVNLFTKTLKSIFNNWAAVKSHMENIGVGSPEGMIGQAISTKGKPFVDFDKMNRAITAIAFVSYHLEDHIENILFLNTTTLDYSIIRGEGGDPSDLLDKIDSGKVVITGGFTWNDAQQTPTPGYNSATHSRNEE